MSWAPSARPARRKVPAYKRQHKAARLHALLLERKAAERAAVALDRRLGRSSHRTEAAFRGCEPREW